MVGGGRGAPKQKFPEGFPREKRRPELPSKPLFLLVGARGFEPPTPSLTDPIKRHQANLPQLYRRRVGL
jgi:hypothetical protein